MSDVLEIIRKLKDRLWSEYGNVLEKARSQDEVHMTYYVSDLLERRGHSWFKHDGIEGACYTEKAMQDAFTAGLRIGKREAEEIANRIVEDRMDDAVRALQGLPL